MKQRVAIARALAIRPQILILDEPFGALDAITKEEMQEELVKIWQEHKLTVLMITHDIDEALFLADRLVMMTNGPSAKIGEVLEIPFERPRDRDKVMDTDKYHELRNYALDFLYNRFAHDEEEEVDEESETSTGGLVAKIVTAIGAIALTGFVGFSLFQSFGGNKASTSGGATTEAPAN
jgi:nitrate/nitrite transport system ATP-binding protein